MRRSLLWLLARWFRAFLHKHNGALASLCALLLIIGASVHAMHSRFEHARQCQAAQTCQTQAPQRGIDLLGLLFSSHR